MTLNNETKEDNYAATMETQNATVENQLFSNVSSNYMYSATSLRREDGRAYAKKYYAELTDRMSQKKDVFHIVSHSMGGAYAKGFVKAIVEFAKDHPEVSNGLKISEFDFDPFQAGELTAVPRVHTEQYTHNGKKHIPW